VRLETRPTWRPIRARALAYGRVSGRGQIDGDGFPRQRDTIARYVRTHGLDVVGEYRDAGVSGTRDLDDREGLAELIQHIRSNGVRLVLVERADRLARDLLVSEVILGQFRDLGVRVVAADSGTDLTAADEDPTGELIRQVLGAVSQFEKSVIVAKLRAARVQQRRQTGRCEGRKPFGARLGEQAVLHRLRQLHRKPRGARAAQLWCESGRSSMRSGCQRGLERRGARERCGES
jgi:DNA invertase Pin-like site-specific DNA recombinase